MNIYYKLNSNIQFKIDRKIEKNVKLYVVQKLLPEIVNYRKQFFLENFKTSVSNSKSFKTDLYYFLNIPRARWGVYGIKTKFVNFMNELLPYKNHDTNSATDSYNNLYINHYRTVEKRHHFIDLCVSKLSMNDLESFFIYKTKIWYYYDFIKVNKLSIHNVIENFKFI